MHPAIKLLAAWEKHKGETVFDISLDYCHSGNIIQGGFVTAMLDAVCTHAVFGANLRVTGVSTFEPKVMFLDVSRMGKQRALG